MVTLSEIDQNLFVHYRTLLVVDQILEELAAL